MIHITRSISISCHCKGIVLLYNYIDALSLISDLFKDICVSVLVECACGCPCMLLVDVPLWLVRLLTHMSTCHTLPQPCS